jgi:hypothetical protein
VKRAATARIALLLMVTCAAVLAFLIGGLSLPDGDVLGVAILFGLVMVALTSPKR